ncbi:hypothetical protein CPB83DRAFT_855827 [Crepidotus variabilis]|uniref:Uncharacterized protein n=1 Tax=Crepidotus variabilis TaxID=179855 RepID=A0A9P6JPC8_9AGAR|nr:hypothetical protein CPB83DRAFT_855827 [Crepidotus variabilis]
MHQHHQLLEFSLFATFVFLSGFFGFNKILRSPSTTLFNCKIAIVMVVVCRQKVRGLKKQSQRCRQGCVE